MDERVEQLRQEWLAEQARRDVADGKRQQRNRRNAVLAGAMIGIVSTMVTAQVTRRAIFWHSFLLEALFGAIAGYVLVRRGADPLNGVVCFSVAYFAAWLLRALGLDPSVLFAAGDLRGALMIQGNFTSLCLTVACGAAVGQVMRD
ncbi:MAG: hypothetical protein AAGD14_07880 [Planctomycetota bacterium]